MIGRAKPDCQTRLGSPFAASLCVALSTFAVDAAAENLPNPLSTPLTACTTLTDTPFDHDWATTFSGWSSNSTGQSVDDLAWASLILDGHAITHESLTNADQRPYIDERFEQHKLMTSADEAAGWLLRFDHVSGWRLALDLDSEHQRIACLLWHSTDQWGMIADMTGDSIFGRMDDVADNAPLRQTAIESWTGANGYSQSFSFEGAVLSAGVLPEAPRSYIAISTTFYTPEDQG